MTANAQRVLAAIHLVRQVSQAKATVRDVEIMTGLSRLDVTLALDELARAGKLRCDLRRRKGISLIEHQAQLDRSAATGDNGATAEDGRDHHRRQTPAATGASRKGR